jgi:phage repressor protein C with HTH and peptisase S24 domain
MRLESAEATLQFKVESKEIDDNRRNELISDLASEMLKSIDVKTVPKSDQWKYASLLRVTNQWPATEVALKRAVVVAATQDRKINDSLKLAQAQARNGELDEALTTATSVLNAADKDAAPILPAVLYEIVPAAEGKGRDKEFADLLKKAIECHNRVKIDSNTEAGRAFLIAKQYHINRANRKISELMGSNI